MTLTERSFKSELRALITIIKKELLIYFRYPNVFIYAIATPFFVGLIWTNLYSMFTGPSHTSPTLFEYYTGTSNYVAFVYLGHVVNFYFAHTLWQVAFALRGEQQAGTLETNFLCPIRPKLLILGRALAFNITSAFSAFFIFLLAWAVVGMRVEPTGIPFIPVVLAILSVAAFGTGLFFAGLIMLYRRVDSVVGFYGSLMYAVSGFNFAIAAMPDWVKPLAYIYPSTWGIEAVRGVMLYNLDMGSVMRLLLISVGFACILILFGSLLFTKFERKVKQRGGLSGY